MDIEVIHAPRDKSFQSMLRSALKRGKLNDKHIETLTDEDSLITYDKAFTSKFADSDNNYETLEFIGDATIGKVIVWYFYRKFPFLTGKNAENILSKLKANYSKKSSLASFADKLGFIGFITATKEQLEKKRKVLLEDTFESFIGATELLIDTKFQKFTGYGICYNIIQSFFDEMDIKLKYDELYDPKTRLKELFEGKLIKEIPTITYKYILVHEQKGRTDPEFIVKVVVHINKKIWFEAKESQKLRNKRDAEADAARNALYEFSQRGYTENIPKNLI
jgi:ribonuclease III